MTGQRRVIIPVAVEFDDLDSATATYEELVGVPAGDDIDLGTTAVRARPVGPILLVAGPDSVLAETQRLKGIVFVEDLEEILSHALALGATIVKDPTAMGDGRLAHVQHADGSVFEYLQA